MDQNVLNAQKYLNSYYGGNVNWVPLPENGNTGTVFIQGIVRAFQIENGLATPNGNLGPATLAKMKSLSPISLMNPDDSVNNNVCLIQCALFGKGYNAGGITGIYYLTGKAAVEKFQSDAGLTSNGIIDWKVWQGLLSLNWFILASGGNQTLRTIQLMFNQNWSDYLGVGPCDGIMSRQTALSPLAALQAQEGLLTDTITDFNSLNFGPATSAAFPGVLKLNQNSGDYQKYNMIAQAALYFNGYDPGNFIGNFDNTMETAVSNFQTFYALTGINLVVLGQINLATMKSLLTSKGDTDREAKGCDCATVLNAAQALSIKNAGYTHVGRYLTGSVGENFTLKFITFNEIDNIKNAGLKVIPIYQDGGSYPDYFVGNQQGVHDAKMAILAAKTIGIPAGSTIYFAVDYDFTEPQVYSLLLNYFEKIHSVFISNDNSLNYKAGIYASRQICSIISDRLLVDYSYVSDMSTGFSGNLGFPIPKNWAFDQFANIILSSNPSFEIDKVAVSGRDSGVSTFDTVPRLTLTEQEELYETEDALYSKRAFIQQVLDSLGLGNLSFDDNIFNAPIGSEVSKVLSQNLNVPGYTLKVELSCGVGAQLNPNAEGSIIIEYANGSLEASASSMIGTLNTSVSDFFNDASVEIPINYDNVLNQMANGIKKGIIQPSVETNGTSIAVHLKAQSDILTGDNANTYLTVDFCIEITPSPNSYGTMLDNLLENRFLIFALIIAAFAILAVAGTPAGPILIPILGIIG